LLGLWKKKKLSNFTIGLDAETVVKRLYGAPLIAENEPLCMQVISQPMWSFLTVFVCSISRQYNKVAHGVSAYLSLLVAIVGRDVSLIPI
jgi:hypothetical protein